MKEGGWAGEWGRGGDIRLEQDLRLLRLLLRPRRRPPTVGGSHRRVVLAAPRRAARRTRALLASALERLRRTTHL